ncbi:MAG TPA: hypothetical protein ENK18_14035 [Deltaproteobacteria bacterium]|nr:hypothetical protein [Deltaproteobacteria bacterium]
MFRIFSDIGQVLTSLIPGWAIPIVLGIAGVLAVPFWIESVRSKQIKGAVRRMVRADGPTRRQLAHRALSLAGQRRLRLIGLVQEAIRYGQHALIEEGLARLTSDPHGHRDAEALRARIRKPGQRFRDPIEASVRIEGLLQQELFVAASEQLDEALGRFPTDPELLHLQRRLSEPREPRPGPGDAGVPEQLPS